jgi:hypothetical protein
MSAMTETTARIMQEPWAYSLMDGRWAIMTIRGDYVAQDIPTEVVAKSMVELHNAMLQQLRDLYVAVRP